MKRSITLWFALLIMGSLFVSACAAPKDEFVQQQDQLTQSTEEAQQDGIKWYTNVEQAQQIAEKENKHIFIHFTGSDWCIWCKRLKEEVYDKKPFQEWVANNMVMVMLDFPRSLPQSEETKAYNRQQAQKYGVRGFPTVVILDKDGKPVSQTGYQEGGPEKYVQHLQEMIK